jgi:hypothetical protein
MARLVFQEDDEMLDAYNVQHCQAMADIGTRLATFAREGGIHHLQSRLLEQPLALSRSSPRPVHGMRNGPRWSSGSSRP